MRHYHVKAGDTPMSIAQGFTGNPLRVRELVDVNQHKQKAMGLGGIPTFAEIGVGEPLWLPPAWGVGAGQDHQWFLKKLKDYAALGAPSFKVESGATLIDGNVAENACGGWTTPSSWPPAMTAQAVSINNSGAAADDYFILYEKNLYKFIKSGSNTTLQICSNFDATKLTQGGPATNCPPGYVPDAATGECKPSGTVPTGVVTCMDGSTALTPAGCPGGQVKGAAEPWYKSPWLWVGVAALGGVGLAFAVTRPTSPSGITPPSRQLPAHRR